MIGKKLVIVSIVILAVTASAVGLAEGTARTAGTQQVPAWQRALDLRSAALDRKYHLGEADRSFPGAPGPGWEAALHIRSDALNRKYGLGPYAADRAMKDTTPEWARALRLRSEALDQKYKLGKYAGR